MQPVWAEETLLKKILTDPKLFNGSGWTGHGYIAILLTYSMC